MAVSRQQRHRLFRRAEELFGSEEGATFMNVVLPEGVGQLVTADHLDRRLAEVRAEIAATRAEFHRELRVQLLAIIAANATMLGAGVAIAQLL